MHAMELYPVKLLVMGIIKQHLNPISGLGSLNLILRPRALRNKSGACSNASEVFPASIRARRVQANLFDGYWEDIGTIAAFYETNLLLAESDPPFSLMHPDGPIYTRPRFLPPTRIDGATIIGSLVADGCRIEQGTVIDQSLVGLRCVIATDVTIRKSVLMGADYLPWDAAAPSPSDGHPPLGIGDRTVIEGAIVDKNCRIGNDVTIRLPDDFPPDGERGPVVVRDGVVVVPRGAIIPDGWSF